MFMWSWGKRLNKHQDRFGSFSLGICRIRVILCRQSYIAPRGVPIQYLAYGGS
jgi:hypothetical protein